MEKSTDQRLKDIIQNLETKKSTHPNLSSLWIERLKYLQRKLDQEIDRAELTYSKLSTQEDVGINTIISLINYQYVLNNT